jgi:transcriptional regulator with XRE-family HTH domain
MGTQTVGQRIRLLRTALGLTQREFADRLRLDKGTISNLETDKQRPSDQLLRLISLEFATSEEWLRTGEGDMFVSPDVILKKYLTRFDDRAYLEAFNRIMTERGLAVREPPTQYTVDPELNRMIAVLYNIWESGDERLKAWASVQFDRAFPPDIQEQVAQVAQKNKKAPRRSSTG